MRDSRLITIKIRELIAHDMRDFFQNEAPLITDISEINMTNLTGEYPSIYADVDFKFRGLECSVPWDDYTKQIKEKTFDFSSTIFTPLPLTMEILINEKPVKKYSHENKVFIEGKDKKDFSIKIKNPNYSKVLAIVSVDGLSVLNGKKASIHSQGYIINGLSSVTIPGWRISEDAVKKFYFTNKEDSYVGKKDGNPEAAGVIGLIAISQKEREPIALYNSNLSFSDSTVKLRSSIGGQSCATMDGLDMGTGMGERKEHKVNSEIFERGNTINTETIYYASRSKLIDIGIDLEKKAKIEYPKAFTNFCEEV